MALLSRYSSSPDQTSSSLSSHSIAIPMKLASGNPFKSLSTIQRSGQKLLPFWADTQVRPTRHPRHRVAIPQLPQAKHPLETPVRIWARSNCRIKSYDPFELILKAGDQTSSSLNNDSITYPRKTASREPCKNLRVIQRSDQKLWPLETTVNTLVRSNSRIKSYGSFEPILRDIDQTSSSLNNDSKACPRKTASRLADKTYT
jgi:hypothetical protein